MSLDLGPMLAVGDLKLEQTPVVDPPQLPVTALDMERMPLGHLVDMNHHMADPCPVCGAFNMRVGDWACFGTCWPCERSLCSSDSQG